MNTEEDYSKVLGKIKAMKDKESKPKSEEDDDVLEVGENGVDISS